RIGDDPGREDDGFRFNGLVRQVDLARLDGLYADVSPDVRAAPPAQDLGPVNGQLRVDLRHEAVARLEQDEADLVDIHALVKRYDRVREGGQLAEQFDPPQPAADDDERELPALAPGVGLRVGALEALDNVAAEQQGVGEGLEGEGVLRAGDHAAV